MISLLNASGISRSSPDSENPFDLDADVDDELLGLGRRILAFVDLLELPDQVGLPLDGVEVPPLASVRPDRVRPVAVAELRSVEAGSGIVGFRRSELDLLPERVVGRK